MSKQDFVVFAVYDKDGSPACFYSTSRDRPAERTLAGLVNYAGNWKGEFMGSTTPIAWAVENDTQIDQLRDESIAAGRLIEKTPSSWVALGAEKQESMTPTLDKMERELRKGEPTSADLAMIARDGAAKPKTYAPFTPFGTFSDAPVSTAKANPFPTTLRSPDCDSGPSDHLNASRHQMAGMKG